MKLQAAIQVVRMLFGSAEGGHLDAVRARKDLFELAALRTGSAVRFRGGRRKASRF
jgi:hypothetical protein